MGVSRLWVCIRFGAPRMPIAAAYYGYYTYLVTGSTKLQAINCCQCKLHSWEGGALANALGISAGNLDDRALYKPSMASLCRPRPAVGTRCCRKRQSFRGGAPRSASSMTAAGKSPITPDLFSHALAREPSLPSQNPPSSSLAVAKAVNNLSSTRHILPKNLGAAVKQLTNQELDQLLSTVLDEQKRRRRKPSEHISDKRRGETASTPLTRGQINAVHAAFKAGVTPARIARQFGLSQSAVRKALAADTR
jgi:hypothetical protein